METALLRVRDLEFIPAHTYAAEHGCGATIIARGTEMREAMEEHTELCEWTEPTA